MTIGRLQKLPSQLYIYGVIILLSIAGTLLVLHRTAAFGVGLDTSDAVNYLSAARSFANGDGYLLSHDAVLQKWTPLFPTLLAVPTVVNIDPLTTGRYLNALAFGCTILLAGIWLSRNLEHKALVVLGTLSVFLAEPFVRISSLLRTEPVYVVFTLLFCMSMSRFLVDQDRRSFGLVILWAALATMQRPVGASLIAVGGLLILIALPRVSVSRRVLYAGAFGVLSSLPLAWWIIRNYSLNNTLMGHRESSSISLRRSLDIVYGILQQWLARGWWIPERITRVVPADLLMGGVLLVVIVGFGIRLRHWERIAPEQRLRLITVAMVSVAYLVFLIITSTTIFTGLAFEMDRFVLPVYALFLWLGFWGLDNLVSAIKPRLPNSKALLLVGVGLSLVWISASTIRHIRVFANQVPSSMYSESAWHDSELMQWVRDELPEGTIYSNDQLAVYVLAGRRARRAPLRNDYGSVDNLGDFVTTVRAQGPNVFFVMFNDKYVKLGLSSYYHFPQNYFTAEELASVMDLELLADLDDGACYRLK